MAINWTEAQIEDVVASVIKNLGASATTVRSDWDSTQYHGRKLIGVYADMNDAIDAATAGYKAIRAMSVEQREKVITRIRELCRNEAPIMAELGVAETKMGRVDHKTAKHNAGYGGYRSASENGRLWFNADGNGAFRRCRQYHPQYQPFGNGYL